MIRIETDRIYCIYCRTNKHTPWRYATYGGRWESPEKAIQVAKDHLPGQSFDYQIINMDTDEEVFGTVTA